MAPATTYRGLPSIPLLLLLGPPNPSLLGLHRLPLLVVGHPNPSSLCLPRLPLGFPIIPLLGLPNPSLGIPRLLPLLLCLPNPPFFR